MRAKLLDWLTFSGDVTTSRATFDAGGVVPLAPLVTARADLAASLAMRHLGDRYAGEERQQTGGRRNSISHRRLAGEPAAGVPDIHYGRHTPLHHGRPRHPLLTPPDDMQTRPDAIRRSVFA